DRDRNRVAYAQARINEIAQRGQIRAPEQRRNSPPRAAETASTSPTLPTRAEHTNRASPEDQDRGALADEQPDWTRKSAQTLERPAAPPSERDARRHRVNGPQRQPAHAIKPLR